MEKDIKKCPFCGENIKAQAKKCRFCGSWLNKQEIISCPYCGEEISSADSACKHCGEKIKSHKKSTLNLTQIWQKFWIPIITILLIVIILISCSIYFNSDSYVEKNVNKTIEKIQDTNFYSYFNWSDAEVSYSLQYKEGMLKVCATFNNLEDRALLAITKTFRNYNDEMPVFYVYLYDKDKFELGEYIITLGDLRDAERLYYNEEDTKENLYVEKTFNVNKDVMKKVAQIDTKCMDVIYVTSENFWSYVVAHQR